jgi:hypothetical protein
MNDYIISNNGMIINGNIGMNQTIFPITMISNKCIGLYYSSFPIEAEVAIETFEN